MGVWERTFGELAKDFSPAGTFIHRSILPAWEKLVGARQRRDPHPEMGRAGLCFLKLDVIQALLFGHFQKIAVQMVFWDCL